MHSEEISSEISENPDISPHYGSVTSAGGSASSSSVGSLSPGSTISSPPVDPPAWSPRSTPQPVTKPNLDRPIYSVRFGDTSDDSIQVDWKLLSPDPVLPSPRNRGRGADQATSKSGKTNLPPSSTTQNQASTSQIDGPTPAAHSLSPMVSEPFTTLASILGQTSVTNSISSWHEAQLVGFESCLYFLLQRDRLDVMHFIDTELGISPSHVQYCFTLSNICTDIADGRLLITLCITFTYQLLHLLGQYQSKEHAFAALPADDALPEYLLSSTSVLKALGRDTADQHVFADIRTEGLDPDALASYFEIMKEKCRELILSTIISPSHRQRYISHESSSSTPSIPSPEEILRKGLQYLAQDIFIPLDPLIVLSKIPASFLSNHLEISAVFHTALHHALSTSYPHPSSPHNIQQYSTSDAVLSPFIAHTHYHPLTPANEDDPPSFIRAARQSDRLLGLVPVKPLLRCAFIYASSTMPKDASFTVRQLLALLWRILQRWQLPWMLHPIGFNYATRYLLTSYPGSRRVKIPATVYTCQLEFQMLFQFLSTSLNIVLCRYPQIRLVQTYLIHTNVKHTNTTGMSISPTSSSSTSTSSTPTSSTTTSTAVAHSRQPAVTMESQSKVSFQHLVDIVPQDLQYNLLHHDISSSTSSSQKSLRFYWTDYVPRHLANFTTDFSDGVVLCLVLHHFFPYLIPLSSIMYLGEDYRAYYLPPAGTSHATGTLNPSLLATAQSEDISPQYAMGLVIINNFSLINMALPIIGGVPLLLHPNLGRSTYRYLRQAHPQHQHAQLPSSYKVNPGDDYVKYSSSSTLSGISRHHHGTTTSRTVAVPSTSTSSVSVSHAPQPLSGDSQKVRKISMLSVDYKHQVVVSTAPQSFDQLLNSSIRAAPRSIDVKSYGKNYVLEEKVSTLFLSFLVHRLVALLPLIQTTRSLERLLEKRKLRHILSRRRMDSIERNKQQNLRRGLPIWIGEAERKAYYEEISARQQARETFVQDRQTKSDQFDQSTLDITGLNTSNVEFIKTEEDFFSSPFSQSTKSLSSQGGRQPQPQSHQRRSQEYMQSSSHQTQFVTQKEFLSQISEEVARENTNRATATRHGVPPLAPEPSGNSTTAMKTTRSPAITAATSAATSSSLSFDGSQPRQQQYGYDDDQLARLPPISSSTASPALPQQHPQPSPSSSSSLVQPVSPANARSPSTPAPTPTPTSAQGHIHASSSTQSPPHTLSAALSPPSSFAHTPQQYSSPHGAALQMGSRSGAGHPPQRLSTGTGSNHSSQRAQRTSIDSIPIKKSPTTMAAAGTAAATPSSTRSPSFFLVPDTSTNYPQSNTSYLRQIKTQQTTHIGPSYPSSLLPTPPTPVPLRPSISPHQQQHQHTKQSESMVYQLLRQQEELDRLRKEAHLRRLNGPAIIRAREHLCAAMIQNWYRKRIRLVKLRREIKRLQELEAIASRIGSSSSSSLSQTATPSHQLHTTHPGKVSIPSHTSSTPITSRSSLAIQQFHLSSSHPHNHSMHDTHDPYCFLSANNQPSSIPVAPEQAVVDVLPYLQRLDSHVHDIINRQSSEHDKQLLVLYDKFIDILTRLNATSSQSNPHEISTIPHSANNSVFPSAASLSHLSQTQSILPGSHSSPSASLLSSSLSSSSTAGSKYQTPRSAPYSKNYTRENLNELTQVYQDIVDIFNTSDASQGSQYSSRESQPRRERGANMESSTNRSFSSPLYDDPTHPPRYSGDSSHQRRSRHASGSPSYGSSPPPPSKESVLTYYRTRARGAAVVKAQAFARGYLTRKAIYHRVPQLRDIRDRLVYHTFNLTRSSLVQLSPIIEGSSTGNDAAPSPAIIKVPFVSMAYKLDHAIYLIRASPTKKTSIVGPASSQLEFYLSKYPQLVHQFLLERGVLTTLLELLRKCTRKGDSTIDIPIMVIVVNCLLIIRHLAYASKEACRAVYFSIHGDEQYTITSVIIETMQIFRDQRDVFLACIAILTYGCIHAIDFVPTHQSPSTSHQRARARENTKGRRGSSVLYYRQLLQQDQSNIHRMRQVLNIMENHIIAMSESLHEMDEFKRIKDLPLTSTEAFSRLTSDDHTETRHQQRFSGSTRQRRSTSGSAAGPDYGNGDDDYEDDGTPQPSSSSRIPAGRQSNTRTRMNSSNTTNTSSLGYQLNMNHLFNSPGYEDTVADLKTPPHRHHRGGRLQHGGPSVSDTPTRDLTSPIMDAQSLLIDSPFFYRNRPRMSRGAQLSPVAPGLVSPSEFKPGSPTTLSPAATTGPPSLTRQTLIHMYFVLKDLLQRIDGFI